MTRPSCSTAFQVLGMTGWRLGWLVALPAAVPELEKLAQNLYISAPSMRRWPVSSRRRWRSSRRVAASLPGVGTSCCQPCASWASASRSSRRSLLSVCRHQRLRWRRLWVLPAHAGNGVRCHHAGTGFRPSPGRPSCALRLHAGSAAPGTGRRAHRPGLRSWFRCASRNRWSGAVWSGATSAFADIVTDEGEAMCIHCPNTGSMLNCMSEGARGSSAAAILDASCPAPGSWWRRRRGDWPA